MIETLILSYKSHPCF